jgi:acetyl esterase/lipase
MPRTFRIPLFVVLLACLIPSHRTRAADRKPPDDVEFTPNVVYGKAGGQELKLDLSRPKKAEPKDAKPDRGLPCVVVIHGGGWAQGSKEGHDDVTWLFAQHGYVAATVGYRLAPAHVFPAQVQDVKCAVRFLRAHAGDYGLDPDHIGAVGFSAGGHLSMMLATTSKDDGLEGDGGWADQSSRVQAAVSFFGPTDLAAPDLPPVTDDILKNFIGGTKAEKPDAYKAASPITYVRSDTAPMLLFQGTKDPLVPHTQATRMADALTKAGVPGRVELLLGQSHGWGGAELKRTGEVTLAFFDEHLKPPTTAKEPAKAPAPDAKPK